MPETILDIDALGGGERPTVRIKSPSHPRGRHYAMRSRDHLSLLERAKAHQLQRRIGELEPEIAKALQSGDDERINEAPFPELEEVIDDFLALIYEDLGDEIVAVLTMPQKEAMMAAFMVAFPTVATEEKAAQSTSRRRSPTSKRSTGATRKRGSTSKAKS